MNPYYDTEAFRARHAFLNESQHASAEWLAGYQMESLRRLLDHARRTVPHYRDLFGSLKFDPGGVGSMEDLRRLPLMTKDDVRAGGRSFLSESAPADALSYMTTGGSTGDPLVVWMDPSFRSQDLAFTFHYLDAAGCDPFTHRSVRLHGDPIPAESLAKGEYWRLEDGRKLVMSIYHFSEETCPAYVEEMNHLKPRYIHAYPSAVSLLCQYIQRLGLKLEFRPHCVFCDSETLYEGQRALIRETFGCQVHSIYGHTEGCVYGMTCPGSDVIHILPQAGVFELLRPDGTPCEEEGERGEIVVTGFQNMAFPLIRYRTFDMGVLTRRPTPCGWNYPKLKSIEGRMQDYVVDREGRLVPLAPALFDYHVDWSGIDRFQVRQEVPGKLLYRLVARDPSSDLRALGDRIASGFRGLFKEAFDIQTEFVDEIRRTSRGKFRYLDQRLKMPELFGPGKAVGRP